MNTNHKTKPSFEEVWNSFNQIETAKANPFLYTRIFQSLKNKDASLNYSTPIWQKRLFVTSLALLGILTLLNVTMLVQKQYSNTNKIEITYSPSITSLLETTDGVTE